MISGPFLLLLPNVAAESSSQPAIPFLHRRFHACNPEVAKPAPYVDLYFLHHGSDITAPTAGSQFFQLLLCFLQGLCVYSNVLSVRSFSPPFLKQSMRFYVLIKLPTFRFPPYFHKPVVQAVLFCKLRMCTCLYDFSIFHHEDLICIFNGCQTVGNGDNRFPTGQLRKRPLDQVFILRVHAGGGFMFIYTNPGKPHKH